MPTAATDSQPPAHPTLWEQSKRQMRTEPSDPPASHRKEKPRCRVQLSTTPVHSIVARPTQKTGNRENPKPATNAKTFPGLPAYFEERPVCSRRFVKQRDKRKVLRPVTRKGPRGVSPSGRVTAMHMTHCWWSLRFCVHTGARELSTAYTL